MAAAVIERERDTDSQVAGLVAEQVLKAAPPGEVIHDAPREVRDASPVVAEPAPDARPLHGVRVVDRSPTISGFRLRAAALLVGCAALVAAMTGAAPSSTSKPSPQPTRVAHATATEVDTDATSSGIRLGTSCSPLDPVPLCRGAGMLGR